MKKKNYDRQIERMGLISKRFNIALEEKGVAVESYSDYLELSESIGGIDPSTLCKLHDNKLKVIRKGTAEKLCKFFDKPFWWFNGEDEHKIETPAEMDKYGFVLDETGNRSFQLKWPEGGYRNVWLTKTELKNLNDTFGVEKVRSEIENRSSYLNALEHQGALDLVKFPSDYTALWSKLNKNKVANEKYYSFLKEAYE